ncbi:MAG: hypothetical protein K5886_07365 [Lachnospiraceae bacterium]|nr:hypothetical protein [Lachnospiraceae bacterium]
MKSELVGFLDEKMEYCRDLVNGHITGGVMDQELIDAIGCLDYRAAAGHRFNYSDELVDAVYFLKYGYAYAYEYHVMYDVLLRDYRATQGNIFGVTCLGCGSLIDAWSLAYSKARLAEDEGRNDVNDLELRYIGNDMEEWAVRFVSAAGNVMEQAYQACDNPRYPGGAKNLSRDILSFLDQESWYASYDTIVFSKILNEIDDPTDPTDPELNRLVDLIRDKASMGLFKRDEYYICISHSYTSYRTNPRMKTIAGEIADAINANGEFDVKDDLLDTVPFLIDISAPADLNCYSSGDEDYLDGDFAPIRGLDDLRSQIRRELTGTHRFASYNTQSPVSGFRYVLKRSQICLQVLKLTRRGIGNGGTDQ